MHFLQSLRNNGMSLMQQTTILKVWTIRYINYSDCIIFYKCHWKNLHFFQENVLSLNISSTSSSPFSPSYSLATVGHNNVSTVTVVNDNCNTVQQQPQQHPTRGVSRSTVAPSVCHSHTPLQPPEEGNDQRKYGYAFFYFDAKQNDAFATSQCMQLNFGG